VSGRDDGGRIYVADYGSRRVVRLSRNARYDGCLVAGDAASTQLVQPQAIDFAPPDDGRLVVVDRTHVKIFDVGVRPAAAAAGAPAGCPAEEPTAARGDRPSPLQEGPPPPSSSAAAAAAVAAAAVAGGDRLERPSLPAPAAGAPAAAGSDRPSRLPEGPPRAAAAAGGNRLEHPSLPAPAAVGPPPSAAVGGDRSARPTPAAKPKPPGPKPKPAVPPRPKYLKDLKFAGQEDKTASRKTARSMSSEAPTAGTFTPPASSSTNTARTRRTSTTVIPNTPTKSMTETEVW